MLLWLPLKQNKYFKAQNDFLNELNNKKNDNDVRVVTRGGKMTQEPLYPEGHPKRIEQDSQRTNVDAPSSSKKMKKKNDRTLHTSSEPVVDTPENPNDISIFDAETQSGNEHEPSDNVNDDVHVDAQPSNNNDVEIEPVVDLDNPQSKNQRYDKRDFIARKHGKEREPWVQKPMPFCRVQSLCISVIPGTVMLTHTVLEGFITEQQSHTYYIEKSQERTYYNKYGLRPSKYDNSGRLGR